jgi:PAS domain S-box-containing protein
MSIFVKKHFRTRDSWQLVLFAVATIVLLFLFVEAQPVDPDKHNALISDLRELQKRDIELGKVVLFNHYQLHHNYDEVVAIMQRMQLLTSGLAQHQKIGSLPDTLEVNRALHALRQQIEHELAVLEEFKSNDSLLKNSLNYLPRQVNMLLKSLPETQHGPFDLIVRDILLITLDQRKEVQELLEQHIDLVDRIIPNLPEHVINMASSILVHARSIITHADKISVLINQLHSQGKEGAGSTLEQIYIQHYQAQQRIAEFFRLLLLLLAMFMLSYAIYLYYQMSKREDQLRIAATAFETQEGIMITDANNNIIRVNKSFQDITGYSAEEVLGKNIDILSSGRHGKAFYAAMWESIDSTGSWQGEEWGKRKNGEIYPGWLSITATMNTDGVATHYVRTQTDITDRKVAEAEKQKHEESLKSYNIHLEEQVEARTKELIKARDEAEKANKSKSKFLSRMSHELRTPLNAILGFGQLLEMDNKGLNETQKDYVSETLYAGRHLLELVDEVLDLTRIEAGKMKVSMDETEVGDILQQSISLVTPQAEERKIELIDHISKMGYSVYADATRLKQILLNFLSNAVKYNREQGCITLDSKIIDKQRLRLCVTDTGVGLTEEEIAKLFTPFERLSAESNVQGTGIGLVITKFLVEIMGGAIGVDSTKGEGSTFWVELALSNPDKAAL